MSMLGAKIGSQMRILLLIEQFLACSWCNLNTTSLKVLWKWKYSPLNNWLKSWLGFNPLILTVQLSAITAVEHNKKSIKGNYCSRYWVGIIESNDNTFMFYEHNPKSDRKFMWGNLKVNLIGIYIKPTFWLHTITSNGLLLRPRWCPYYVPCMERRSHTARHLSQFTRATHLFREWQEVRAPPYS